MLGKRQRIRSARAARKRVARGGVEILETRQLLAAGALSGGFSEGGLQIAPVMDATADATPPAATDVAAVDGVFGELEPAILPAAHPAAPVLNHVARQGTLLRVALAVPGASPITPLRVDFFAQSLDGKAEHFVGSRTFITAGEVEVTLPIPEGVPLNPVETGAVVARATANWGATLWTSAAASQAIQFETVTLHDIVWRSGQHNYDSMIVVIYDDNGENGVRLERTARMQITNSVLRLQDPLVMKGGTLSIVNSTVDDRAEPSSGNTIETSGAASVSLQDVTVTAGTWKKWKFQGTSVVTLNQIDMSDPRPWLVFTESARVTSTNTPFHGSIGLNARATISGSSDTFVELIFDGGNVVVDENLPEAVGSTAYAFPGANDTGVGISLSIANSIMTGGKWGLTMDCRDNITLRDSTITANLTLFDRAAPKVRLTGTVSGLTDRVYGAMTPETITISGVSAAVTPKLTLDDVFVEHWYPYAGPGNTLTVRNSVLADSAHSWGKALQTATNVIENSTTSYVRANDYVRTFLTDTSVSGNVEAYGNGQITLTRAYVSGDVIAAQNSVITLGAGSTVLGHLITSGNGRIVTSGGVHVGAVVATDDSRVTLDGETLVGGMTLRDTAVVRIKGKVAGPVDGVLVGTMDDYAVYVSRMYARFLPGCLQSRVVGATDDTTGPVGGAWRRWWVG